MLCCVSHITILPVFTGMMNVRDQTRQAFVLKLLSILWPHEQVYSQKSPNTSHEWTLQNKLGANFWKKISNWSNFLLLLNWWSSMHGVATLYNCCVVLFASSQHLSTHFFARPSMSQGPWANVLFQIRGSRQFRHQVSPWLLFLVIVESNILQ